MRLYLLTIILLFGLSIKAQYKNEISFQNIETGKIQKICKGDFVKIYALNSKGRSYKVSGRFSALDGDLLIFKNNKAVAINEIQKIKHMSNGRRVGIIFGVIIFSLISFAALFILTLALAYGGASDVYAILAILGTTIGIIAFKKFIYFISYDIMYNFQTDWKMIIETNP